MRALTIAFLFGAAAVLIGCSDDKTSSSSTSTSSSSGSSGDGNSSSGDASSSSSSGATSSGSSGSNTCGYAKDCVEASPLSAAFCPNGVKPFQCCKPATPAASAGCTKASGGENSSAATYCCTGVP